MFNRYINNRIKKITGVLFISLICILPAIAQDIHFSQFWNSPTYINPALTGVFDGNLRIISNYRNQWQSVTPNSYETMALYIDGTPFADNIKSGFIGTGIGVYNDRAGDGNLGTTQFNATFSYTHYLAENQSLGAGMQIGYAQRSVDFLGFTWDNQWDGSSYNSALGSGESGYSQAFSYLDVSAGLLWYFYPNEKFNLKLGASMYHVNSPNQSFYSSGSDKLYQRMVMHLGMDFAITTDKLYVLPRAIYMRQGPSQEMLLGSFVSYILAVNDNMPTINGGLWYRNQDALVIATELWYGNFRLGLSYDINVSGLSVASQSQGGPEVSLTSTFPLPGRVKYKKIPCPINF